MTDPLQDAQHATDSSAVVEGGSYALIKRRLDNLGDELKSQVDGLNQERIASFGSTDIKVKGRVRVRTENNCVPRDSVAVGDLLIFAFNVFIGLKNQTQVHDVFSLHKLVQQDDHYETQEIKLENTFLDDPRFVRDFEELYAYYKQARLQHLYRQDGKLFAVFRIGERLTDVRVFRWGIDADEQLEYIDNRGERDVKPPQSHDFEWVETGREHHEQGKFPHINVRDVLFVENLKGTLTFKVENNTDSGQGIYAEPVEDKNQSLADCELAYAEIGELLLLKVLPYREKEWRYFIFNRQSQQILRQDAIGNACVQLPEDHGIIFPGGYYLMNGQSRSFEDDVENLEFHRQVRSPNGEDVLYIFYEPDEGRYALLAYNMIERNLQNPIHGHGYTLFADGTVLTFKCDANEAERVHPVQIWQSPFFTPEFHASRPQDTSLLGKIGNPDLVRGISDFYSLHKLIKEQSPARYHYEQMIGLSRNLFDRYHWLSEAHFEALEQKLHQIFETSEQVLDEFEKVAEIQGKAKSALSDAKGRFDELVKSLRPDSFKQAGEFVAALDGLKQLQGHLVGLEDIKYMDKAALAAMGEEVKQRLVAISLATAEFLQGEKALQPYREQLAEIEAQSDKSEGASELKSQIEALGALAGELDLLNHTMLDLEIDDSRIRTQILEDISGLYALVNRAKANVELKRQNLGAEEAKAEFAARFKLFSQSITAALNGADTPEACDEQLSRLVIQLEELESMFGEHPEFIEEILEKREQVHESFEKHKQALLDKRQRRAHSLGSAAERILEGINRRCQSFKALDELNTYFASDPMIGKLRKLIQELRELDSQVKADDLDAKFKASKDQGIRALRDKQDIYSDGGDQVKIGKHSFNLNRQQLDLTLLPKDGELQVHLSGTDFFEGIANAQHKSALMSAEALWDQDLLSESGEVYRGEYLAGQILLAAINGTHGLDLAQLYQAQKDKSLEKLAQGFAEPRYQEGYEKGIHSFDASLILDALLRQKSQAGLLVYPALNRALACLYWASLDGQAQEHLKINALNAHLMQHQFSEVDYAIKLQAQIGAAIDAFLAQHQGLFEAATDTQLCAEYLIGELAAKQSGFIISDKGRQLAQEFMQKARTGSFDKALSQANSLDTADKWNLYLSWLNAFNGQSAQLAAGFAIEAAVSLVLNEYSFYALDAAASDKVQGLLGQHKRISEQSLEVEYAEFYARLRDYSAQQVPAFNAYHKLKSEILELEKARLQLHEFKARPLSSFVRNQLIDRVYFPIIGDNLAKQIGAAGADKRTDLMGMLLLISPPGYGKTTLIEYVANRLGLTFVKVNCPSIGHDQVSLDPEQAINATAAKEIEKINLSFEMGNNVMLYLDDIQHTHPEFLQKFISLCDGSRRIDGVWQGQSKTYDLRGKKFAVVMAGNPYTETGESFQIPDMLANRADIYNLGDTLSGCEAEFGMSFIENALTSNAVLAPLANRSMEDLYKFVRICQGEQISLNELEHGYSQAEANEIQSVLSKLLTIRDTVLKVNAQYIDSAAQDPQYRTEPPFKLQGSYRNMNKMAEKVVAVMNDDELENLIQDHYKGESQTLSKGSEENLLKLGELRGTLDEQQAERWAAIKEDFCKRNRLNAGEGPAMLAVEQLANLNDHMQQLSGKLSDKEALAQLTQAISQLDNKGELAQLAQILDTQQLGARVEGLTQGLSQTLNQSLAASNTKPELVAIAEALAAQQQSQSESLAGLTQGLSQTLNQSLAASNTKPELVTIAEALAAQQHSQSESLAGLTQGLSQTLNQSLAASNTKPELVAIAEALAAQQHSQSESLAGLTQGLSQTLDQSLAASNTKPELVAIAEALAAQHAAQTEQSQQLVSALAQLDNKEVLNQLALPLIQTLSEANSRDELAGIAQALGSMQNSQTQMQSQQHTAQAEQAQALNTALSALETRLSGLDNKPALDAILQLLQEQQLGARLDAMSQSVSQSIQAANTSQELSAIKQVLLNKQELLEVLGSSSDSQECQSLDALKSLDEHD